MENGLRRRSKKGLGDTAPAMSPEADQIGIQPLGRLRNRVGGRIRLEHVHFGCDVTGVFWKNEIRQTLLSGCMHFRSRDRVVACENVARFDQPVTAVRHDVSEVSTTGNQRDAAE